MGSINLNLCIFCQKLKQEEYTHPKNDGFDNIQEKARERKKCIDTKYGSRLNDYLNLTIENVKYHRTCYSYFTTQANDSTSSSSVFTEVTDWSLCVLCQKKKKKDTPRKMTDEVAMKIEECAKKDPVLRRRIRDTNLVTAKVLYHGLCMLNFEKRHLTTHSTPKEYSAFNDLCAELRVSVSNQIS